ncbi:Ribonuclease T(2) protein [Dioscorea alata]|uniref:Ribonuclease T(2) protein n=1 Tax=Dioscorea alata TaxID=55571 RepID=A0ACB7W846_DIOAL|nr:Ribonuclease T(2) protein [Dioscorea alata]
MKSKTFTFPFISLLLLLFVVLSVARSYDFFYFVQQWPGSHCDTRRGCCYPTTGINPEANFTIHGLWPNYDNGKYPHDCDYKNRYDATKIKDLLPKMQTKWPTLECPSADGSKLWAHEWNRYGTCSESILDQHSYFRAGLDLQNKANILSILEDANIRPNGELYSTKHITEVIKEALGVLPSIECNRDASRNPQLFQIYLCVDKLGKDFIDCPFYKKRKCSPEIEFPKF